MSDRPKWIGVDLDGTLAFDDGGAPGGPIGPPIPAMLDRVKRWLAEGREVRIVTARVTSADRWWDSIEQHNKIDEWSSLHIGQVLQVTCAKDPDMEVLYDDRAIQVEKNTGKILGEERIK